MIVILVGIVCFLVGAGSMAVFAYNNDFFGIRGKKK